MCHWSRINVLRINKLTESLFQCDSRCLSPSRMTKHLADNGVREGNYRQLFTPIHSHGLEVKAITNYRRVGLVTLCLGC
ncbi:unnamed protein product [Penicillium roqueforti FM164]|uniref:Genomic scaffold, ProqFM164S04 n=1 Tax=Penicillium roqueforti (strain FM164) TaxID=1365484 RepID=W6R065_PENRF|nr:unnamed protein product [Penicillium roqueforti FM164]